jgi:hypothetical protein
MRKQIINDLTAIDKILDMADERLNELIKLAAEKNFLYYSAEQKAEWEMENIQSRNEVMRTKEHYQKRWDEILGKAILTEGKDLIAEKIRNR